ncbi:MAG TPA: DMT family transporter [Elusimicrobiales bacterium]|nr:DMT family transporter [Elusimicrobiales bacterium]
MPSGNAKTGIFPAAGALLAALFFGVSTPLSKPLTSSLDAFTLAGLLYLGAGLGLAALAPFRRSEGAPAGRRPDYRYVAGMIVCGGLLGPVFLMLAVKRAPAASVAIWLNMELVATALLGWLFFKDHLHARGWLSAAITLAAGLALSYDGGAAGLAAGGLTALACLCWAFDNHFTALIDDLSPSRSTMIKGLAAGSVNLLIGLALAGWTPPPAAPALKALLVGFAGYGLSITLYIASAQRLGAVRGQLAFSTAPVFGVVLSVFLLGERLSAVQLAAGALLFGSVLLMLSEKHAHAHAHAAMEHSHAHTHDDLHHGHSHDGPAEGEHSHFHSHEPVGHEHPHWPDLHHRHGH